MTPSEPLPCPIRAQARSRPGAQALVAPNAVWTYAGLDRAVQRVAGCLAAEVEGNGTRVGLCLPRSAAYLITVWALFRAGCTACPVSTRLPTSQVGAYLRRIQADTLVAPSDRLATLHTDDSDAPDDALHLIDVQAVEGRIQEAAGDAGRGADAVEEDVVSIATDHPATIIATSGSTGTPKAALHAYSNHYYSAEGSNQNIPVEPGDRWVQSLPLYHVGGLAVAFRCWIGGGAVVVPPSGRALGTVIEDARITHVSMVATQLRRLLHEPAGDLRTLKAVLLGGGAIPEDYLERAHAQGLPVHTSYGLTEMASQVATTPPGTPLHRLRSSGRVLPHRSVRTSEEGELLVRGRTLFQGYLGDDGSPKAPGEADGWFHTGDRGHLDADRWLYVTGRMDRMFISGGENIQPEEIERALEHIQRIEQAVVVPVPDDEYGHRPVAFVRLKADNSLPGDLAAQLRRTLPGYKVPDAFYLWPDDLATEGRMKVDYAALRSRAVQMRPD